MRYTGGKGTGVRACGGSGWAARQGCHPRCTLSIPWAGVHVHVAVYTNNRKHCEDTDNRDDVCVCVCLPFLQRIRRAARVSGNETLQTATRRPYLRCRSKFVVGEHQLPDAVQPTEVRNRGDLVVCSDEPLKRHRELLAVERGEPVLL